MLLCFEPKLSILLSFQPLGKCAFETTHTNDTKEIQNYAIKVGEIIELLCTPIIYGIQGVEK